MVSVERSRVLPVDLDQVKARFSQSPSTWLPAPLVMTGVSTSKGRLKAGPLVMTFEYRVSEAWVHGEALTRYVEIAPDETESSRHLAPIRGDLTVSFAPRGSELAFLGRTRYVRGVVSRTGTRLLIPTVVTRFLTGVGHRLTEPAGSSGV